MAICSPYGSPALIERSERNDRGGVLADLARIAFSDMSERDGYDPRWIKTFQRKMKRVGEIAPYDWDQLTKYMQSQGWLGALDKDATALKGYEVYKQTPSNMAKAVLTPEEEGMAAAVTKTYLESVGGGLKEFASNFINKVNAGEDATQDGLFLARQMQGASRFAGYVLGWDRAMGRALRTQGLRQRGAAFGGVDDLNIDNGVELAEGAADKFTEIAMMLQAGPEGQQQALRDLMTLARRVQFADDPIQALRIGSTLEVSGGIWNEVWINGLLSAPATAVTNMVGASWAFVRPVSQLLGAVAWEATGILDPSAAKLARVEALASLSAMSQSWMDAAKLGWQAAKSETSIYKSLTGATEVARGRAISGANAQQIAARYGNETLLSEAQLDVIDQLGGVVRLPSRLMMGTDEFAKHIAIRGEVAARGVRRAYEQLGPDVFLDEKRLKTFLDEEYAMAFKADAPDARNQKAVDLAYDYAYEVRQLANEVTFQEPNAAAQAVNKVTNTLPVLKPFVPFVKTPLNIMKQGFIESTGIGAAVKAGKIFMNEPSAAVLNIQKELLADPGESARMAGQIALTTTLGAVIYNGVMNGTVIGGGPGRFRKGGKASVEQRAWEQSLNAQGRQKYSVMTPFGSVPWDRIGEPMTIVLKMYADIAQVSGFVTEEEKDEMFGYVTGIMASGLYQGSFLQGIDNLMGTLNDDEEGRAKARAVQNYVQTQTPFGGLLNYVDKIQDPYRKAYGDASFMDVLKVHEDTWTNGIMARITDRLPGMGGKQPTMIDQVMGEPVPAYAGVGPNGLNPLQLAIPFMPRGKKSSDDTWQKIFEISGRYSEWSPQMEVTQTERQAMNKLMSEVRIDGLTFKQWVNRFHSRPDVQRYIKNRGAALSDETTGIMSDFNTMKRKYGKAAEVKYMLAHPEYRQRFALDQQIREKKRNNDFTYRDDMQAFEQLLDLVP